jgi:hypothetical protein
MAWARPERFVTLTQAPEEWQARRAKVRKLRMRLAQLGRTTEWAWTTERGSRTGMIHVHALQRGSYVPQRELEELWGRRVDIRKIGDAGAVAGYAMKEASRVAGYAMKEGRSNLSRHLDLNGGRGCHLSRGYLHGLTSAEVWAILHPSDPDLTWLLVPTGTDLPPELALG